MNTVTSRNPALTQDSINRWARDFLDECERHGIGDAHPLTPREITCATVDRDRGLSPISAVRSIILNRYILNRFRV